MRPLPAVSCPLLPPPTSFFLIFGPVFFLLPNWLVSSSAPSLQAAAQGGEGTEAQEEVGEATGNKRGQWGLVGS